MTQDLVYHATKCFHSFSVRNTVIWPSCVMQLAHDNRAILSFNFEFSQNQFRANLYLRNSLNAYSKYQKFLWVIRPILFTLNSIILHQITGCNYQRNILFNNHLPETVDGSFQRPLGCYQLILS